jgi:valyl-tRNA synthetase
LRVGATDPLVFTVAGEVLAAIRKEKSEQKVSLASPVERVLVCDTVERIEALHAALGDVRETGKIIGAVDTEPSTELAVKVWLVPRDT